MKGLDGSLLVVLPLRDRTMYITFTLPDFIPFNGILWSIFLTVSGLCSTYIVMTIEGQDGGT